MKKLCISVLIGIGFVLLVGLLFWLSPVGAGGVRYVAPDCVGVPIPCYTSVQDAVGAALTGDSILVASGVYSGDITISKTVTVRGGYTTTNWTAPYPITQPTVLDAQGQGRVIYIAGDISPVLDGLCITGGDAQGLGGELWSGWRDAGGGIYAVTATVTVSNCRVYGNGTDDTNASGGGMYLARGNAFIVNSTFEDNEARFGAGASLLEEDFEIVSSNFLSNTAGWGAGGARLFRSTGIVSDSVFSYNTTPLGPGGLYACYGSASIISSTFSYNVAGGASGIQAGMGTITMTGNKIFSNTGMDAAGVFIDSGKVTIVGDVITGNVAKSGGGGLYLHQTEDAIVDGIQVRFNEAGEWGGGVVVSYGTARIVNSTISDNKAVRGSGVYFSLTPATMLHTTIARNTNISPTITDGGAGSGIFIYTSADVLMTNTIVSEHEIGIYAPEIIVSPTLRMWNTLWYSNGVDITGSIQAEVNFEGDPLLGGDGYTIEAGSPAVNKGAQVGVSTDIIGQPRDENPDLGAFEVVIERNYPVWLPTIYSGYGKWR